MEPKKEKDEEKETQEKKVVEGNLKPSGIYDTPHANHNQGGVCMKGNVYTSQKCPVCQGKMSHVEPHGCICPEHQIHADHGFLVRFGRDHSKRFKTYYEAMRHLTYIRAQTDDGKYDCRDWQQDNPLSFKRQAQKWLTTKEAVSKDHYGNLNRYINIAVSAWGNKSVKDIGYSQIEDLLLGLRVSDKTKNEYLSCYRQFFKWLQKREKIPMPDLPEIDFILGWRNIIDISTQQAILAEVKRICLCPRIYIGIRWLSIYIAIRPGEMRSLKEKQININGMFTLPPTSTKEKKPKIVPMLQEDIDLYNSLPRGLPDMYFFRRENGNQVDKKIFWRWWKKACNNLGVEGVDLYGGTRHSSASAMTQFFTPDEIRDHATKHGTNKAFERYCQSEVKPSLNIYSKLHDNAQEKAGKVVKLKRRGVSGVDQG